MEILHLTDSPHVVRCHGTFEKPPGDIAILMEYMNVGTLDSLLKTHGTFSEPKLADVARQILNVAERRGEEEEEIRGGGRREEENGRRRKKSRGRREEEKMIGFFFVFLLFTFYC
jgi:hypothetical protein